MAHRVGINVRAVLAATVVIALISLTMTSRASVAATATSVATVVCPMKVPGHQHGYSADPTPPERWTPPSGVDVPAGAIAFASPSSAQYQPQYKYVQYTISPPGYTCDAHDSYQNKSTDTPQRIAIYAPGDPVPVWNIGADKQTPYQVPLNVLCGWFPVLQTWQKQFGPQPSCEQPRPVPSWEHAQFFSDNFGSAFGVVTVDAGHSEPFLVTSGHSDGATAVLLYIQATMAGGGVDGGGPECAATPGYAGSCRANLEQFLSQNSSVLGDDAGVLAAIRSATEVSQAAPSGTVTLTIGTLPGTAQGDRFTPSTRFRAATKGFCSDGLSPTIAVHSDVTGQDVKPPVLTYLPGTRDQFFVGQVGAASVQARCGDTVAAQQAIVVQADDYVALGDSYAAGEGDSPDSVFLPGTAGPSSTLGSTGCHRSPNAWANYVARWPLLRGKPFDFVACSGGVISDLYDANASYLNSIGEYEPPQIFSVDSNATKLATLSIGGNNVGFQDIVSACIADSIEWPIVTTPCESKKSSTYRTAMTNLSDLQDGGDAVVIGDSQKKKTLASVYVDIASRLAKNGVLIVVGYPQLFSTNAKRYSRLDDAAGLVQACNLGNQLFIRKSSAMWIDSLSLAGNDLIANQIWVASSELAASRPDVQIVMANYDAAFDNHRVCDGDSWINGVRANLKAIVPNAAPEFYQTSFHPDRQGQAAIATVVTQSFEAAQWDQTQQRARSLAAGSASTLSAAGFDPGEQVVATLHSAPVKIGTYRANAQGIVDVPVRIPAGFPSGPHAIVLTGETSLRSQSFGIIVTSATASWWRPYMIPASAALVVVLILGAGVLIRGARRRRPARHEPSRQVTWWSE